MLTSDGKPVKAMIEAFPAFGDVELLRPESAGVYDNRGGKSTTAATFTVVINTPSGPFVTKGAVYGRLKDDGSVKFNAALPKGITAKDDAKDAFDAHINNAIMVWTGRNRAWSEAYERLTAAPKAKGSKAAKVVPPVKAKDGEPEASSTAPAATGEAATV